MAYGTKIDWSAAPSINLNTLPDALKNKWAKVVEAKALYDDIKDGFEALLAQSLTRYVPLTPGNEYVMGYLRAFAEENPQLAVAQRKSRKTAATVKAQALTIAS